MDQRERPEFQSDDFEGEAAEQTADRSGAGAAGMSTGDDPQRVREVVGRRSYDEPGEVEEDRRDH